MAYDNTREASHGIPLAGPIGWTRLEHAMNADTRGIDEEIIARAGRPVSGDRLEWNGQVCEVIAVTFLHNVGEIVKYALHIDGKVTYWDEFLRNWPARVEKTILRGAVFVPSNTRI